MSDFPIPNQVGVFGLIDRQVLSEMNRLPERNRYLPGLAHGLDSINERWSTSGAIVGRVLRSNRCGA